MTRTQTERDEIRARFGAVDTSNVADALDELGLHDQGLHPELAALSGDRLAGWAFTIAGSMFSPHSPAGLDERSAGGGSPTGASRAVFSPHSPAGLDERSAGGGSPAGASRAVFSPHSPAGLHERSAGDPAKMAACARVGPGEVTVWAGDGEGVCYFGELIALGMAERGAVGALVDGGVRDLKWLRRHGFPVFGRYRTPVQSIGRWRVTGAQEPVYLRGATSRRVTVHPGDFVLADEDGAIVVPDRVLDQVLASAERLTHTEVRIRAAIADGVSLQECLDRFGHV